ncbi:MAG TPA: response regulator [Trinickia sp.]|jgi:DNA-binding response OmpR family regulator|uniref:response regulator n=1 Tax=Trinickia sp. TaxID=2571163 RepID=UPI002C090C38|nr:response regulator [Trinickia sp.]HTI19089.1 response regulator [Trinickia sp.]
MSDPALQILLVDDDEVLRDLLRTFFQQQGVEISVLHDASGLARRLQRERPSIIVLDVMMPGVDGLTALKQLRSGGDSIPVIMLTARAEGADRIIGLELGADDYLGKPFMPQELLARIRAVLRRQGGMNGGPVAQRRAPCRFGAFEFDFATRTLCRDGKPVKLTGSEYALLEAFASHPLQTLSRAHLLELLDGARHRLTERGIDVPVWRLRRLLEDDPSNPRRVRTVRGIGYMFVPDQVDEHNLA